MALFLDTGDMREVEYFHQMGILQGVTTNPTILYRGGVRGARGIRERSVEIARLIAPLPLSVEVTTNDPAAMLEQGLEYSQWASNINVKITIHGPQGEQDNLRVVHELETKRNVRVNVTAMMSAQQCFLAALSGATYVSIFGGRVNNMGHSSCAEIRRLRGLLDSFKLPAKIIAGSTREILNIVEWWEAGAHIVTATPDLIRGMLVHPYSKETVQMFLNDAAKLEATNS